MTMSPPAVEFFYGIGSRYSYLASTQLDRLAAETGYRIRWRPLFSGDLFAARGRNPFTGEPASGQYDWAYRRRDAGAAGRPRSSRLPAGSRPARDGGKSGGNRAGGGRAGRIRCAQSRAWRRDLFRQRPAGAAAPRPAEDPRNQGRQSSCLILGNCRTIRQGARRDPRYAVSNAVAEVRSARAITFRKGDGAGALALFDREGHGDARR